MRSIAFLLALFPLLSLSPAPSAGGQVTGKVTLPESGLKKDVAGWDDVVVWVEGVKDVKVPTTKLTITQSDVQFSPSFLVAVAGQTVEMPNQDNVIHNVFSKSSCCSFDLGFYPKGQSKSVKLEKPGLVELQCSVHKAMSARILVVPSPYFAQVKGAARFQIAGVPPGTYTLKAWQRDCPEVSQTITVAEGGTVTADLAFSAKK